MLTADGDEIVTVKINPSNNAIQIDPFLNLPEKLDAIAYRFSDQLLYGLNSESKNLYQITSDKQVTLFATLGLDTSLDHYSFGFSSEGSKMVFIGSANERGESLEIVEFDTNNFSIFSLALPSGLDITDLSANPQDGLLYGVNRLDKRIISFNVFSYDFVGYGIPNTEDEFHLAYCNAFGEVLVFGSTAFGVASALFKIDNRTFENVRITTGPESDFIDLAACPFNIGAYNEVTPLFTFPCNTVEYVYTIANATGKSQGNLMLESKLPSGFKFDDLISNPLGGNTIFTDDEFTIKDLTLASGVKTIRFTVELENIPADDYTHQFSISNIPNSLGGGQVVSDNPITAKQNDATRLEVKVVDRDSVFQDYFFCITDDAILDGAQYGSEFNWYDGSDTPSVQVYESGIYELQATSGCNTANIYFDVTIASCPFTISLDHVIEPDSVFPCSEVYYYYILNNDTGLDHYDINFSVSLDQGLSVLELVKNPFDGNDKSKENQLLIENMDVPLGIDTIIFLVEVGNISPALYPDQATVSNFPPNLGSFRLSDDPKTLFEDSTTLTVLGLDSDSLFVPLTLCADEEVTLDGSLYGYDFLWYDGSSESSNEVDLPGVYELKLFSGCDVSYVFFQVEAGPDISISFESQTEEIRLGDSILLVPQIISEGDSLSYFWEDARDTSLSCISCLETYANPYRDTDYWFYASNEICSDSFNLTLVVDNTRRLYVPNIISKSASGVNDKFFIQSSDFNILEQLVIYDRYGNEVFQSKNVDLESNIWRTKELAHYSTGVYVWQAEITFLDQLTEHFTGTILIID